MQFKKVDICGFKSFPDIVELEFETGITAIVGPNGCGKTNILDAIRWVLGEQSSKILRGKEMADLIFNGGANKKPKGMAEVSLTLFDADKVLPTEYNEVTITRRLFRSGESEYLINKNLCRLKDIQELFMDTGVGADVYSIIEQSQIDLILSNNAALRRSLFEEAAGITKYKTRKKETLRKLESTEQNLLRLNDIVDEVKRQMNSLKRQANRAERYKKFHDESLSLELKLDSFLFYDWQEEHRQYKHDLTVMEDERQGFSTRISTSEAEMEKIDVEILQIEDKLNASHEAKKIFFQQVENLVNEIAKLNENIAGLENREKVLTKEIEERENKIKETTQDVEVDEKELAIIEELINKAKEELSFLEKETEGISTKKKVEGILMRDKEKELSDIENKLWSKEKTREDLIKEKRGKEIERENISKALIEISQNIESLQKEINEKKTILTVCKEKTEKYRNEKAVLKQEQSQVQTSQEEILSKINDAYNKFAEIDNQIKIMEQLEKESVGYSQGVKELIAAENNGEIAREEIFSPLVSRINIHAEYKTALEAALGEGIHYFLTATIDKVRECIEYLHNNEKGRVVFVPLENFSKKEYPRLELSGIPLSGKIQPLLDLMETEERLRPIVSFLLNGYFVIDETPSNAVLKQLPPDVKLITLKGEVFSSERISGGKNSKNVISVIGRRKDIEELKQKALELKTHLDNKTSEKEAAEKRAVQIQAQLIELDESINRQENTLSKEEKLFMKLELDFENLNKKKDELENVMKNWEVQLSLKFEEGKEIEQLISDILQQKEKTFYEINELKIIYADFEKKETELQKNKLDKKINLTSLEEKKIAKQEMVSHLQNTLETITKEINERREEKNLIKDFFKKDKENLSKNSQELDALKKDGSQKDFGQTDLENQQRELRQKWKELEEKVKSERKQLEEIDEKISGLKIKEVELRIQEDNLKEKLGKSYNLSFHDGSYPIKEEIDVSLVKSQIEKLQGEMNQMGLVNMMALEEYREVEERFNFLSIQQKDLEDAKNNLTQTINKINHESEERFKATFEKIRENFRSIFGKFFKEGRADIVLDENNLLESDIEIIAQPPGKRPESIQLLSGGERTLTAIGLLLSIFMVKPSPFLILDEVDAPLDDPNVWRFVEVIREFAENTQFIVITHNKRTMEMADCLYGVTMEEPGVSKIVSVSFKKKNKDSIMPLEHQPPAEVVSNV